MTGPPPPGCWSCGALPADGDIAIRSVIHPRSASEGGPWSLYRCRECGLETAAEPLPGGGTILAPLEAVGAGPGPAGSLLGGRRAVTLRKRAILWVERWGKALEGIREARRRSPPGPVPPPPERPPPGEGPRDRRREGRDRSRRRPPPPPRPEARGGGAGRRAPVPPGPDLPRTREEARRALGLGPSAGRKEIDAAFRKASRRCHPDLVAHLDEEFQRLAHAKFLRLKRAHEILTG